MGGSAAFAADDFDPKSEVSACVLWLDATDVDANGTPDPLDACQPVTEWADKSGQGHHAVQDSVELQPSLSPEAFAGKTALNFDGSDMLADSIVLDWSRQDWTLVVTASLDADTVHNWRGVVGVRFGPGAGQWWTLGTKSDGNTYLEMGAGRGISTNVRPADSCLHVYTAVKRGTALTLYRDGLSMGTTTTSKMGGMTNQFRIGRWFGESQGWKGNVGEILLFERALAGGERGEVESYLSDKWSVPIVSSVHVKKDTWAETMLASRAALAVHDQQLKDFPFDSDEARAAHSAATLTQLWGAIEEDFPAETGRMAAVLSGNAHLAWFRSGADTALETSVIKNAGKALPLELDALVQAAAPPNDPRWLQLLDRAAALHLPFQAHTKRLAGLNVDALERAVRNLTKDFPDTYPQGAAFLTRIAALKQRLPAIQKALDACDDSAIAEIGQLEALRRDALLANPLLDFDQLLLVRRSAGSPALGLPQNWQSNCILPTKGFNDEIALLAPVRGDEDRFSSLTTLYKPEGPHFVGDVDLHFDADRMLFSSIGAKGRWQVFEIGADGSGLRQVTPGDQPDVNNYDACYLPDERIMFCSTAYMAAVPCVNGGARTANLYRMDADGANIRQLCFDQEHNWCPTVLPNGRLMYLRWEYTDTPHSHDRVLFHMNPDGTEQMEYYGSNSYWPNSLFYARPLPGQPSQFVGIVGGHHGVPRMGELVLFDSARGRRESKGALQRIPGYGIKVASTTDDRHGSSLIVDNLVDASWPKFLHPYPLHDKYLLVSCKPTPSALWGIYLVDVFDNILLLKEEPGQALLEPVPLRKTPRPPVIPDRVDLKRKDAVVHLADVYVGDGLKGIPRGSVKQLRLISYHFLYPKMGGPQAVVGMEGPWDIKRIMGTVPVEADGSACFRIPANTPVAVQPLDENGKALQLMRSWFTAMPGEVLSCVGCHEAQNSAAPVKRTIASRQLPSEITPWYGPSRGFNFDREVQPVLDKYCIGCHSGSPLPDGRMLPDFKTRKHIQGYTSVFHSGGKDAGHFSMSYVNLHRYVRRPGLESDYHMLTPMEYHADSTQLVQRLLKGHGGVKLDPEAWDRLITWIDLNAPYHGTWHEIAGKERVEGIAQRRRDLLKLYAGMDEDPEAIYVPEKAPLADVSPERLPAPASAAAPQCAGWPLEADAAKARQTEAAKQAKTAEAVRTIDLGDGMKIDLVLIPAGEFVMGGAQGFADERPLNTVRIEQPFWMARCEITNEQFRRFDFAHDSRVESRFSMQFGVRGFYVNGPGQPVVRVSWEQAMAFCAWLSEKTGESFALPTEAQWEYACRAGTDTPFFYGDQTADFSPFANLADQKLREFVCHTYKKEREPWLNASKYDDWIPKDLRFNDGGFLSDTTGAYQANPWGLHDMHGNVCEWTRSAYRPYPFVDDDGRNDPAATGDRVARGGSWRDRPHRARSGFRQAYRPYQPVYNVGFRVMCPAGAGEQEKVAKAGN